MKGFSLTLMFILLLAAITLGENIFLGGVDDPAGPWAKPTQLQGGVDDPAGPWAGPY